MGQIMAIPEAFLKSKGVKNPKLVIFGAGAIIVGLIGLVIYRKIKQRSAGNYSSGRNYTEMTDELSSLNIPASKLTLTQGEATIISQNLFAAMNRWGTDENAVIDSIGRAQTKEDLYLITQKFGIKPYDGLGLSDTFLSNKVAAVMKNLNGWIRSELSGSSLRAVESMYDNLGVPF